MVGYYDRPIVKPPEWTDLIPTYFFTGGMAGTCASLAFAERVAKNDTMARPLLLGALAGTLVSGFCLIADLKRPERFLNMLRVFKPTSPMSVGVYIFSAFGGAVTIAAACEFTGVLRPIGRIFEGIAALLGPAMSCYTAVLISDTVVPAWQHGRKSMPFVFAATSAATAGGWGLLFGPMLDNGSPQRLAIAGGAAQLAALNRLHEELGPRQKQAYERGEAAMFSKAAKALTFAGTAAALFAHKNAFAAKAAGAMLLAAGLCERFGVYRAGCVSAKDPGFVIDAQHARSGNGRATQPA
jgi:hypothetical protein